MIMNKFHVLIIGLASAGMALAQPLIEPQQGKAYYVLNPQGDYMTWNGSSLHTLPYNEDAHQRIYFEPVSGEEGYYNIIFDGVDGCLAGDKSNGWTAVISTSTTSDLSKFSLAVSSYDNNFYNILCKGMTRGGGMLGQDAGNTGVYTDKSDGALSLWEIVEADRGDKPGLESISLDRNELQLGIYEGYLLSATFTPAEAASHISWSTSDAQTVSVTSRGMVRGLKGGKATITALCGDKTAQCQVTVVAQDKYPQYELAQDDVRKNAYDGYKLVFAEEFSVDGDPDYDIWNLEDGYRIRNNEDQYYLNPNSENGKKWGVKNAYIQDGVLVIEARNDSLPNPKYNKFSTSQPKCFPYSSASLQTKGSWNGGYSWLFGIYEIRAKIKAETGLWPAIWSTGEQYEWPQGGEIDIMEYYGDRLHANVCWGNGKRWGGSWNSKTVHMNTLPKDWDEDYHIWKMVWDYDRMQLWVDDILINDIDLDTTVNVNPHEDWYNLDNVNPFREVRQMGWLNLALGGNNGGSLKNTTFPSYYLIDYFRVYQRIGSDGLATYHVDSEVSEPTWTSESTGIESVTVDFDLDSDNYNDASESMEPAGAYNSCSKAEYYDINGCRIKDLSSHKGFCILKIGNKVKKIWVNN